MNRILKILINHLAEKRKTLFLIDSLGALLTAFFLLVVLPQFNKYFGMPKTILTYLSILAICLGMYSTACFLFLKERWATFISIISIANLLYCAITIALLIKYYSLLTLVGTIYFLIEIVLICILSYIELNVATEIKKREQRN